MKTLKKTTVKRHNHMGRTKLERKILEFADSPFLVGLK